jgi:hypothetical protein
MAGAPGGVAARIGVRVTSALAAALVVALVLVVGGVALVVLVGHSLTGKADEAVRDTVASTLTFYLLIAVPILVVLTGLVTYLFAGRALSAVEAVRERAAMAVDMPPLPEPMAQDEVSRLVETLDALVGRLDEAAAGRRRLAAAGNELRAPLATVAAGLDRIQRGQAAPAAIAPMRTEIDRLARLVDALISGAPRPDPGPPTEQVPSQVGASGPLPAVRPGGGDAGDPTTVITPLARGPQVVRPMRDEDAREDPVTHPRGIPVVRPTEGTGPRRYPPKPPQAPPGPPPGHQPPPHTNPRGIPAADPRSVPPGQRGASGQGW